MSIIEKAMTQTERKKHFAGESNPENEIRDIVDYDQRELILELMNDEFNYHISMARKYEEDEENYEDDEEYYEEEYDESEYDDEEYEYEDEEYDEEDEYEYEDEEY